MRVLILAKEDHVPTAPTPEMMAEFQAFNEELVKAGVVMGDGRLYPSGQAKRLKFDGRKRTVIDGPFTETKEMVAGYWLWQGRSMGEGPQKVQRAPLDAGGYQISQNPRIEGKWRSGCPRMPHPG